MSFKFNPFTGTLDVVDTSGGGGAGTGLTNLDGGAASSSFTAVGLSPIDGGDSASTF